jgi:restriction system protein
MIETLNEGDYVEVVVREGTSAPFIAGRDGRYIFIRDQSLTPGEKIVVQIQSIHSDRRVAYASVVTDYPEIDLQLTDWSQPDKEFSDLARRLQQIDPYEFESFISKRWEKMGWEARTTSGSGDGGKDVVAMKKSPVEQTHCIQAKRNAETNPVGVDDIRNYGYLINQDPSCDVAILVTTGRFSSQAENESDKHNIRLIDGEDLADIIRDNDCVGLVNYYARVFS